MATLNLAVAASNEDADERKTDGSTIITSTSVRMGDLASIGHAGFYFGGVSGLAGATINSATLTFVAGATDTGTFDGAFYFERADSPAKFAAVNFNITDRTRTTASVAAGSTEFGNWTADEEHVFTDAEIDLVPVLQEVCDNHDPDALVLIYLAGTGTGERLPVAYDGDPTKAAKLDIDYTPAGGGSGFQTAWAARSNIVIQSGVAA